jgi:hypothetical protein
LSGFGQGEKNVPVRRFVLHLFGVPLNAQHESAASRPWRILNRLYRLDDPIGRPRSGAKIAADFFGMNGLMMEGIRLQVTARHHFRDPFDNTPRFPPYGMAETTPVSAPALLS